MKYKNVYFSLKIKKVVPVSATNSSIHSDADPQALPSSTQAHAPGA